MKPQQNKGFTLIELLVVIGIIGILAALVLQTAGYVQKKAATSKAEAEIAALATAIENYKADNGDYPEGAAGDNSALAAALMPLKGKVYFEIPKRMMSESGGIVSLMDPFGEPYNYVYPGVQNGTNFFDLWSTCGGSDETAWKKNW